MTPFRTVGSSLNDARDARHKIQSTNSQKGLSPLQGEKMPIADEIKYNPYSTISEENQSYESSIVDEYFIELSPFIKIPVDNEDLYESIMTALDSFHLDKFLNKHGPISQEFLDLMNNPMKFDANIDFNLIHPLVYYLTGIFGVSLSQMIVNLNFQSPKTVLLTKINTIVPTNPLQNPSKKLFLVKYSPIFQLGGYEFINRVYDLVNGNEGFVIIVLTMFMLDSLSKTFNIEGFENFNHNQIFEQEIVQQENIAKSKLILKNLNNEKLEEKFPKLSDSVKTDTKKPVIILKRVDKNYSKNFKELKFEILARVKGLEELESKRLKTDARYNYKLSTDYDLDTFNTDDLADSIEADISMIPQKSFDYGDTSIGVVKQDTIHDNFSFSLPNDLLVDESDITPKLTNPRNGSLSSVASGVDGSTNLQNFGFNSNSNSSFTGFNQITNKSNDINFSSKFSLNSNESNSAIGTPRLENIFLSNLSNAATPRYESLLGSASLAKNSPVFENHISNFSSNITSNSLFMNANSNSNLNLLSSSRFSNNKSIWSTGPTTPSTSTNQVSSIWNPFSTDLNSSTGSLTSNSVAPSPDLNRSSTSLFSTGFNETLTPNERVFNRSEKPASVERKVPRRLMDSRLNKKSVPPVPYLEKEPYSEIYNALLVSVQSDFQNVLNGGMLTVDEHSFFIDRDLDETIKILEFKNTTPLSEVNESIISKACASDDDGPLIDSQSIGRSIDNSVSGSNSEISSVNSNRESVTHIPDIPQKPVVKSPGMKSPSKAKLIHTISDTSDDEFFDASPEPFEYYSESVSVEQSVDLQNYESLNEEEDSDQQWDNESLNESIRSDNDPFKTLTPSGRGDVASNWNAGIRLGPNMSTEPADIDAKWPQLNESIPTALKSTVVAKKIITSPMVLTLDKNGSPIKKRLNSASTVSFEKPNVHVTTVIPSHVNASAPRLSSAVSGNTVTQSKVDTLAKPPGIVIKNTDKSVGISIDNIAPAKSESYLKLETLIDSEFKQILNSYICLAKSANKITSPESGRQKEKSKTVQQASKKEQVKPKPISSKKDKLKGVVISKDKPVVTLPLKVAPIQLPTPSPAVKSVASPVSSTAFGETTEKSLQSKLNPLKSQVDSQYIFEPAGALKSLVPNDNLEAFSEDVSESMSRMPNNIGNKLDKSFNQTMTAIVDDEDKKKDKITLDFDQLSAEIDKDIFELMEDALPIPDLDIEVDVEIERDPLYLQPISLPLPPRRLIGKHVDDVDAADSDAEVKARAQREGVPESIANHINVEKRDEITSKNVPSSNFGSSTSAKEGEGTKVFQFDPKINAQSSSSVKTRDNSPLCNIGLKASATIQPTGPIFGNTSLSFGSQESTRSTLFKGLVTELDSSFSRLLNSLSPVSAETPVATEQIGGSSLSNVTTEMIAKDIDNVEKDRSVGDVISDSSTKGGIKFCSTTLAEDKKKRIDGSDDAADSSNHAPARMVVESSISPKDILKGGVSVPAVIPVPDDAINNPQASASNSFVNDSSVSAPSNVKPASTVEDHHSDSTPASASVAKPRPIALFSEIRKKVRGEINSLRRKKPEPVEKKVETNAKFKESKAISVVSKQMNAPFKNEYSSGYQSLVADLDKSLSGIIKSVDRFSFALEIPVPKVLTEGVKNIQSSSKTDDANANGSSLKRKMSNTGNKAKEDESAKSNGTPVNGSASFKKLYNDIDKNLKHLFSAPTPVRDERDFSECEENLKYLFGSRDDTNDGANDSVNLSGDKHVNPEKLPMKNPAPSTSKPIEKPNTNSNSTNKVQEVQREERQKQGSTLFDSLSNDIDRDLQKFLDVSDNPNSTAISGDGKREGVNDNANTGPLNSTEHSKIAVFSLIGKMASILKDELKRQAVNHSSFEFTFESSEDSLIFSSSGGQPFDEKVNGLFSKELSKVLSLSEKHELIRCFQTEFAKIWQETTQGNLNKPRTMDNREIAEKMKSKLDQISSQKTDKTDKRFEYSDPKSEEYQLLYDELSSVIENANLESVVSDGAFISKIDSTENFFAKNLNFIDKIGTDIKKREEEIHDVDKIRLEKVRQSQKEELELEAERERQSESERERLSANAAKEKAASDEISAAKERERIEKLKSQREKLVKERERLARLKAEKQKEKVAKEEERLQKLHAENEKIRLDRETALREKIEEEKALVRSKEKERESMATMNNPFKAIETDNQLKAEKDVHVIGILEEMFPYVPSSVISDSVKEVGGDQARATDILLNYDKVSEAVGVNTESSSEVNMLRELFPRISTETIDECLKESGNDPQKAVETLLSHSVLQEEISKVDSQDGGEEKFTKVESLKPRKLAKKISDSNSTSIIMKNSNELLARNLRSSSKKKESKSWSSIETDIKKVQEFTGLPKGTVKGLYHKNYSKVVNTIVEIISAASLNGTSKQLESVSPLSQIPSGGRVQNGSGKQITSSTSTTASKSIKPASKGNGYKYDETSDEARSLDSMYYSNPEFHTISQDFLRKALCFYEGNISKIIDVVAYIVENDAGSLTFGKVSEVKSIDFTTVPMISSENSAWASTNKSRPSSSTSSVSSDRSSEYHLSQSDQYLSNAKNSSSKIIASHYASLANESRGKFHNSLEKEQRVLQNQRLSESKSTHRLDLHNFTTDIAVETVELALNEWWSDELRARESQGNIKAGGYVACQVEPMVLVTGRGIHSKNGFSRNKKEVKSFLQRNDYNFEENQSTFVVQGKRGSLNLK